MENPQKAYIPGEDLRLVVHEKRYIQAALKRERWNKAKAAKLLGITPITLTRKMMFHNID